jgi:hypothetical protein
MNYRYTADAEEFMKKLSRFDKPAFEKWVSKLVLLIGSNNVIQYLDEKRRWNTKCVSQGDNAKCDFSQQAKNLIKQMGDFDDIECRIWFGNSISMTKADIQNYLDSLR